VSKPSLRLHVLLGGAPDRNEAHRRARCRLADSLGVGAVVLLVFTYRPHKARGAQSHLTTKFLEILNEELLFRGVTDRPEVVFGAHSTLPSWSGGVRYFEDRRTFRHF